MERKLIKQGGGGYTIYLPKKWVDRKGLKAGEKVDVTETDSALLIGSPVKGKKQITITITDENRKDTLTMLTHIYRRGFDIITIKRIDSKLLKEITNITKDLLLGFEVTERNPTECKIENISEPTEEKYETLLRRIFLIIKETQDIIIRDFKNNSIKNIDEIEEFRKQQDKFILFCRRIITKERYEIDPVIDWELLTFLMHIEHAYYYLYKFAAENKVEKDSNITEMLDNLKDYFNLFYSGYFKKDLSYIHKINSLKNKYQYGKCFELIKGKNPVIYSYIRELFRLMQIGTSPILSKIFENI